MDSSSSSSRRPSLPQRLVQAPPLELGFGSPSPSHNPSIEDRVALLLRAAHDGYVPKIKTLVKRLEENAGKSVVEAVAEVKAPWSKAHGPLHMAASAGKVEACKFLIEKLELDVNATGTDGVTPLGFAVHSSGSLAVVKLLLDHKANPNRADSYGSVPLHIATIRGTYEMAELLLSRGAYVDPMWESKSPLYIAAQYGDTRMVELLLSHEAKPNDLVHTPLKAAIFSRSLICMELLVKAGACVNVGLPETPLIAAAAAGLTDFVKCLLKAGADANIPDNDPVLHEDDESDNEAEGDATFYRRDYSHALTLYTMAMEIDPGNSTLYAKRSLCFLHTGYGVKALEDATAYKDMQPDLSKSCYAHRAALFLVKEYGRAFEAILSGLNLDFGSEPIDKSFREGGEDHP